MKMKYETKFLAINLVGMSEQLFIPNSSLKDFEATVCMAQKSPSHLCFVLVKATLETPALIISKDEWLKDVHNCVINLDQIVCIQENAAYFGED